MQPVQLTDDSARITFKLTESDSVVASTLVVPDSVPLVIQGVIQEYTNLFQDPDGLPPSRPFDHQIPLIPRTQPVNVRPYRYGPHQKTEIEKQVTKMLQKGIIQRSMSFFASLVLLVKKKDDTWRFCVDYRQLNNVTVKDNFQWQMNCWKNCMELRCSLNLIVALGIIRSGLLWEMK